MNEGRIDVARNSVPLRAQPPFGQRSFRAQLLTIAIPSMDNGFRIDDKRNIDDRILALVFTPLASHKRDFRSTI